MLNNLKKINLEKYLKSYQGDISKEKWILALDVFVGTLSRENISVLQEKINPDQDFYRTNDLVYEIMVACAYHPKAVFIRESGEKNQSSYDLFDEKDNLKIEVKALSEGDDEKERHKKNETLNSVAPILTDLERQQLELIISNKCSELLKRAVRQIESNGKIYLVWDRNLFTSKNIGTKEKPEYVQPQFTNLTEDNFRQIVNKSVSNFKNKNVLIEEIFFGDLQKKVADDGHSPL